MKIVKYVVVWTLVLCMLMANVTTIFAAPLTAVNLINDALPEVQGVTPKVNILQIAGSDKEFILLDNAGNDTSKYFVMAKDDYGKKEYDADKTQKFDPDDKNNIASWLNDEFKMNGNGEGKKLPSEILSYIDTEHLWQTEPGIEKGNCPVGYEVKAGVALISQTEYMQYYKKFGIQDNMMNDGQGWWLRTPYAKGNNDIILCCRLGDNPVKGRTIQWPAASKLLVRPVFYLNKDFFKSVKLNVYSLGKNVKETILKDVTADELKKLGYTEEEINVIKDTSSEVAENINLTVPMELGNIIDPQNAKFNVDFLFSGTKAQTYTIQYSINGSGLEVKPVNVEVQPKVKKVQVVDLKGLKNGSFTLDVVIKCGERTCKALSKQFYIVPTYKPQFMDSFSEHAMGTHFPQAGQSDERDEALLNRAGIKTIRDNLAWSLIEKTKGEFNFSPLDKFVNPMTKEGINIIPIVGLTNSVHMNQAPSTKEEIDAFCNYITKLIQQYPQLREIELWNEANLRTFWKPSPDPTEYVKLMKAVSETIRKIDPTIKILGGSINSVDTKFLNGMYQNGAYSYMDAVSFHPYICPEEVDKKYRPALEKMQNCILENGGWKDAVITEVGWPTHIGTTGSTEDQQATELIKMYIVGDSKGIKGNAVYSFKDSGTREDYNEDRFGVIRRDFSPKPAYIAINQMNMKLGGATYFGEINLTETINAHLYKKNGAPLMVLWTTSGEQDFDFGTEAIKAQDMMGNAISGSKIHLGRNPVYIEGLSNVWFNKAASSFISIKYDLLLKKWQDKLTVDSVKQNIQNLNEYAKELVNNPSLPAEKDILDKIALNYGQGKEMIELLKGGKSSLSEVETSEFLYQLHIIGESWGNVMAATVKEADIPSSLASREKLQLMEQKINDIRKTNMNGSLPYTQAIARYMREFSDNAEKVKNLPQSNKGKAGIIKSWDAISIELSNWVGQLLDVEKVKNTAALLEVSSNDTMIYIGEAKNIKASVRNFTGKAIAGKLKIFDQDGQVVTEGKDIAVPVDQTATIELPVLFSKPLPGGKAIGTLKLFENDIELASVNVPFKTQDKVDMQFVAATGPVAGVKSIKLKLTNSYSKKITGKVTVKPPQGWSLKDEQSNINLESQNSQEITFAVTKTNKVPFNFYSFDVSVTNTNGEVMTQRSIPLSFATVVKNDAVIDPAQFKGDITNWSDAYPVYIAPPARANIQDEWSNSEVSGMIFTKWDENYFYVLGNVYDNAVTQKKTGVDMWDGDSIQMSIDAKNTRSHRYDADDYEYGLANTDEGVQVYSWQVPNSGKGGLEPAGMGQVIRDNNKNVTRYLLRLPKEKLQTMEFRTGYQFGLNIGINDADSDKRDRYVQLTKGTTDVKEPEDYYTWSLSSAEKAAPLDDIKKYGLPIELTLNDGNQSDDQLIAAPVNNTVNNGGNKVSFIDLEGHWAKNDIEEMVSKGIVKGVSATSFAPDANITRAEFLALLIRAAGMKVSKYTEGINDISVGSWYADTVQTAAEAGIIPKEMLSENNFKPEAAITREEMTALIVTCYSRVKNTTIAENASSQFSDKNEMAPWAEKYVNAAFDMGIVKGVTDTTFAPKANADRAQAVVITKRFLAKLQ